MAGAYVSNSSTSASRLEESGRKVSNGHFRASVGVCRIGRDTYYMLEEIGGQRLEAGTRMTLKESGTSASLNVLLPSYLYYACRAEVLRAFT